VPNVLFLESLRGSPTAYNAHLTHVRVHAYVPSRTWTRQAGGRLALVELPALVGCDLPHCERQAAAVVAEGGGNVLEAQGELITVQVRTCGTRLHGTQCVRTCWAGCV